MTGHPNAIVLAILAASGVGTVRADDGDLGAFHVSIRGEHFYTSYRIDAVFTDRVKEKLTSGLTTTLLLHTAMFEEGRISPLTANVREIRVKYDVWEERFAVYQEDKFRRVKYWAKSYDELVDSLKWVADLAIAKKGDLARDKKVQLRVRVDIDPVSKELMDRVRAYVENPGGHRDEGRSRSLFGSLARLFGRSRQVEGFAAFVFRSPVFSMSQVFEKAEGERR
ncbi:MAG: DUF4390 domain-containing protein [Deltaproteobacteria bacterium]|nr:DUF4390 domain-containing protein [Deltaproteobacteria bacterium]